MDIREAGLIHESSSAMIGNLRLYFDGPLTLPRSAFIDGNPVCIGEQRIRKQRGPFGVGDVHRVRIDAGQMIEQSPDLVRR